MSVPTSPAKLLQVALRNAFMFGHSCLETLVRPHWFAVHTPLTPRLCLLPFKPGGSLAGFRAEGYWVWGTTLRQHRGEKNPAGAPGTETRLRILPHPRLAPAAQSVCAQPGSVLEEQTGRSPVLEKGGRGVLPRALGVLTWGPFPPKWGPLAQRWSFFLRAHCQSLPGAGWAPGPKGVALHPLPPSTWPSKTGLAHRCMCVHGLSTGPHTLRCTLTLHQYTHSGAFPHCSHCLLKIDHT